jgi:hypothetical protein
VISAEEIANAPAALKALAGPSGQITKESLRPPHHPEDGGPNSAPGGDANTEPHHGPGPRAHGPKGDATQAAPADATGTPAGSPPPGGPPPHHGPPPMPLFDALDTNHDGVISADEIANASASLKTLDKNGDGQLTPDEYHPHGPPPPPPAAASN